MREVRRHHRIDGGNLPPLFPGRRTRIGRRGFTRNISKRPRGSGRAGQTLAPRALRNPGGNRTRRNGRDLSRPPAALPPDRGAEAHPVLSGKFKRDAGALPARSGSSRRARSSEHHSDLRGERERGRTAVFQHEVRDWRKPPDRGGRSPRHASRVCATCWPRSRAQSPTRTTREFCIATCNRETFCSMAAANRS